MTQIAAPTMERIKQAGEAYIPPSLTQKTKRPYGQALQALDTLFRRGSVDGEQYIAGCNVRLYHEGLTKRGYVSSGFGERCADGTPIGQQASPAMLTEDWPITCGNKLREARSIVGDAKCWDVIILVCCDGLSLTQAGKAVGAKSDKQARRISSERLTRGLNQLALHYGLRQLFEPG